MAEDFSDLAKVTNLKPQKAEKSKQGKPKWSF